MIFGDFFRCPPCNQVHLDVAAVILNPAQKPVGVLVLTNQSRGLPLCPDPILAHYRVKAPRPCWFEKKGDDVLFLNMLRHRTDPALTLRLPLSRTQVPAVQAVLGKTGIFEGIDYRGVKVLSDIRPIPDTPWFMVDQDRPEGDPG